MNIKNKRLPDGWQWVKLGELAITGPNNGIFKQRHEFGRGVPIVNVYDLYRSLAVDLNAVERVEVSDKELRSYAIAPGDLFFCRSSLKREGIGWCCYVRDVPEPAVFDCHVMRVRLNPEKADSEFVAYYWRHPDVRKEVIKNSRTATMTTMNQEDLSNVDILLPPLAEQKRIAAIAQKADRLRRTRRYALQLSDTYLQSVFLEMFGNYLTQEYPNTPLSELVTISGGGTPTREVAAYYTGNIPWITAKDMQSNYIIDAQEHITEEAIKKSATKLIPKGSILIVVKSKVLMHRLPLAIAKRELCHNQDIKSVQCSKKVHPYFILYILKYNEPQLLRQARGANTEGLTLPMLDAVPVPDVALPLQEKFAQIVQKFERLRTQQREAERQAEHLFQTLLHRAFRGELTSQDGNDKPASVLLEQIGAQQAQAEAKQQDAEAIQLKLPGIMD